MLKTFIWKNLSPIEQAKILQRPAVANSSLIPQTQKIIDQVRNEGDNAIKRLTKEYDQVDLQTLQVTDKELNAAEKQIDESVKNALKLALKNIQLFHQAQLPKNNCVETTSGVICEMQYRAIERVGLYVPGGTATLPSAVLMLGVPAQIAGCQLKILCSPPRHDGNMDPHILFAAKLCEIKNIYKVGGAQAIAAMAYGTQTIPKVDKVFGPGNAWVTQAKILVAQDTAGANCDMPAGPTEQMVIADNHASPIFVAADLLSQAEHGADSQVILICDDINFVEKVNREINRQIISLPRKSIAEKALLNSCAIIIDNYSEAIKIANQYAPEHLLLQIINPRNYVKAIQNAGSVFLGAWSPESVGDYASGTNHVLPTYGYAKSFSGLSLQDFMKRITFQELTQQGLKNIAFAVETLAAVEGLEAHRRAVSIRLEDDLRAGGVEMKHVLSSLRA